MNTDHRFDGINRLYGKKALEVLKNLRVCVIGLGGVGSWAVESLARSGVGHLTLIDYDEIAEGNINRQIHALGSTIGIKKHQVMAERVKDINPNCHCESIDDYLTDKNIWEHLAVHRQHDYVIDAIDSIKYKAQLIYYCKRNKIPVVTTGGAGGVTHVDSIVVKDLSRTYNDALAARVRAQLRNDFNFTKNTKRYFGVECVFSTQKKIYPSEDGSVSQKKPGIHGVHLDCRYGYGSISFITATFGFMAASRVINKTLAKHLET